MPYCELLRSPCLRKQEADVGRCDDCSESEIKVREEIEKSGLHLTDVEIIRFAPLSSIHATDLTTNKLIVKVKRGLISYGTGR